jgi:hypothetical protein
VAVAELLPELGSGVADATVAVSEMSVPDAVPNGTFSTTGKVALALAASVVAVQKTVPVEAPTAGV